MEQISKEAKVQIYVNKEQLINHEFRIAELEEENKNNQVRMNKLEEINVANASDITRITTVFKILAFIVSAFILPLVLVILNYMIGAVLGH